MLSHDPVKKSKIRKILSAICLVIIIVLLVLYPVFFGKRPETDPVAISKWAKLFFVYVGVIILLVGYVALLMTREAFYVLKTWRDERHDLIVNLVQTAVNKPDQETNDNNES